jgi:tetratricopeptide (TPR) repeat protein
MARVNLRAAFMSGLGSPMAAQQVFANRVDEISAFFRALGGLEEELATADPSPVVDRVRARRNVLGFYGVGGIGKTTLSHELERRFLSRFEEEKRSGAVAVRIDLAEAGATDLEALLLRLRAGLGRLSDRWLAFDLALSCYWARAHPGEPLQQFLDNSPLIRRAAAHANVGQQIASNVQSIVPADLHGLPGVAQRAGLVAYRFMRDRARNRRLLADCDLFAELIEADPDHESLSFFPYLLAWDLEQLRHRGLPPTVCVFLDTFEAVSGAPDRRAESQLQRCIYLMPNVLFVVTGRNRLDWADVDVGAGLDFVGQERWPNLHYSNHTDEPRQHLVGYLSDSDADSYLRAALTEDDQPAMPGAIRERIIAGGQGLPLYLDLSVSHFVEVVARNDEPDVDDFGGSFVTVATRTIRDLPHEERDLVRTAALIDRFDAALLRAGQPTASDGRIARFLQRLFLMYDDSYALPCTLHLALRMAIGDADETMPDGWSDTDRHQVAQRLLHQLGDRIAEDTDRHTVTTTLDAGLRLAREHGVFDDWLVSATERLAEAGQWASLEASLSTEPPATAEIACLEAAIQGVVLRRKGDAPGAVAVLERAAGNTGAESRPGQLVRVHLAHALRNTGDYDQAAELYRTLLDTHFDGVARYWLCDNEYLHGRFRTALDVLGTWRGQDAPTEGERLRLLGHIARVNAQFDQAIATYTEAVLLAREEELVAAEAKALVNLAQTKSWTGDVASVHDLAARARELLDVVPNPVELVKLRSAEAATAVLADDPDSASTAIEDTRRLTDGIAYRGGHNLADVVSILLAARTGDPEAARSTLQRLHDRTVGSGGNYYWVPIAATWMGSAADYDEEWNGIEWLDGAETLRRWARLGPT